MTSTGNREGFWAIYCLWDHMLRTSDTDAGKPLTRGSHECPLLPSSSHPCTSHGNDSRTDLAAAGKMGLEARHTGVDGFTALQAGESCGGSPPTTPHKGHPTLTPEHSGASLRAGPWRPGFWAGWVYGSPDGSPFDNVGSM